MTFTPLMQMLAATKSRLSKVLRSWAFRGFALVLLLSNIAAGPRAASGPGSDGGGASCRVDGNRFLAVDIALYQPSYVDDASLSYQIVPPKGVPGWVMEVPNIRDSRPFGDLLSRLSAMMTTGKSPALAGFLASALHSIQYFATNQPTKVSRAFVPESSVCQADRLYPVILYQDGYVVIHADNWNRLGYYSQIALLTHEALRHLQLTHGFEISDKDLQDLTYRLITIPVADQPNWDNDPLWRRLWENSATTLADQKRLWELIKTAEAKDPAFFEGHEELRSLLLHLTTALTDNFDPVLRKRPDFRSLLNSWQAEKQAKIGVYQQALKTIISLNIDGLAQRSPLLEDATHHLKARTKMNLGEVPEALRELVLKGLEVDYRTQK